jgi:hypothetical protein
VARTLADLTLKLSQDLEALDAICAQQRDKIEADRDRALMEIGSAKKALKNYNKDLASAKNAQMKAVQKANELRDDDIRDAEEKRRRAAFKAEQKHRRAKDKAFRTRQKALRDAKKKWKADLEKISDRPLSEQRSLRKAADQKYEDAVEKARDKYQEVIEEARVTYQSAMQDALAEERLTFERANQVAERMISSAVVEYERAIAEAEGRLRAVLANDPKASRIQEEHDRRLSQTRKDCERKREALFKKFTEDRKKLSR